LTTHGIPSPDSTRPVVAVFDIVGGSMGRLLDTVHEPGLAVLATAIRQNRRSKQEAGDEGEIEEHSECEGAAIYRYGEKNDTSLRLEPKA
jgi:hypothetical protein